MSLHYTTEQRIALSPGEVAAIRRCGGTAYVGLLDFLTGRRGARYRNIRTDVYRTPEGAQRALDATPRYKQANVKKLLLVDATGAYEEIRP